MKMSANDRHTLHRDFAKFFFNCSDTELWMFLVLAALPDILQEQEDDVELTSRRQSRARWPCEWQQKHRWLTRDVEGLRGRCSACWHRRTSAGGWNPWQNRWCRPNTESQIRIHLLICTGSITRIQNDASYSVRNDEHTFQDLCKEIGIAFVVKGRVST